MKLENNISISSIEIPTQEKKLLERLNAIDISQNNALEEVKKAVSKNLNWSQSEVDKYVILIDTIMGDFKQMTSLSKQEDQVLFYSDIQGYVDQLPNVSGLRDKVKKITTIKELEGVLV